MLEFFRWWISIIIYFSIQSIHFGCDIPNVVTIVTPHPPRLLLSLLEGKWGQSTLVDWIRKSIENSQVIEYGRHLKKTTGDNGQNIEYNNQDKHASLTGKSYKQSLTIIEVNISDLIFPVKIKCTCFVSLLFLKV